MSNKPTLLGQFENLFHLAKEQGYTGDNVGEKLVKSLEREKRLIAQKNAQENHIHQEYESKGIDSDKVYPELFTKGYSNGFYNKPHDSDNIYYCYGYQKGKLSSILYKLEQHRKKQLKIYLKLSFAIDELRKFLSETN